MWTASTALSSGAIRRVTLGAFVKMDRAVWGAVDEAEFRNCADVTIEPLESSGYLVDLTSRSAIGEVSDYMSLDCGGQKVYLIRINLWLKDYSNVLF